MKGTESELADDRVLILMPTVRDSVRTREAFIAAGLTCEVCADTAELCEEMDKGAGVALLTEESVTADSGSALHRTLRGQPAWSDFPLVVLAREGAADRGRQIREAMNATLVERPVKMRSLLSVVRAALRSRRRQYEVRDHLAERDRAEHDRARLAAIVESTDDAVISKSLDGVIQSWNFGAERLFGYSAQEIVGRQITALIPSERLDEERDIIERLRRAERIEHFDTVRVAKDGRRIDVSLTVSPIRNPSGQVIGASKVARDITGRRRSEAELSRLAETLGLALDAGDLGTWEWDPATDDMLLSARAGEIYGVEPNRPHKREELRSLLSPDHRDRAREAAVRASADRTDYDLEYPLTNGRWVSARGRGVFGPDGRMARMIGVVQDVTARRRQEESLRRSEGLLRLATDAAELGVWVWDLAADRVSWENDRPYQIFGIDRATGPINAARFRDEFVHPDDAEEFSRAVGDAVRSGERFQFQGRLRRPDGDVRWIEFAGLPLRTVDGEPLQMHGTAADITERKRFEQELRQADRKKDEFIALLAHELRNPLAPIRNGIRVLQYSAERTARDKSLEMMDRQLTHMVRLIDDLLDVSRISRNKMELRLERVTLADVVSSAVETAQPALDAAGHVLTISLPPAPVFLDADLTRLAQVFSNLLTNSAKYTPDGGKVRLEAKVDGGTATISVQDNGIGIPAASLAKIFDMFSQVDRSIERTTGGLGIGLALVKGLTEMHGGAVTVESSGRGTTFTVTLPIQDVQTEPLEKVKTSSQGAAAIRRVLVVDDNHDGAESLTLLLEILGHQVTTAFDGMQAVERAATFRPDLILMDVGMPNLNGYEATRRIRANEWGKGITIIALTGWGQDRDRRMSHEAGCDGHLVKPVGLSDLEQKLQELYSNNTQPVIPIAGK